MEAGLKKTRNGLEKVRSVGSSYERDPTMTRNVLLALCCLAPFGLFSCNKAPAAEAKAEPAASAAAKAVDMPVATAATPEKKSGPALTIAYSDWPGWVAWDIAMQKGWFKEEGVDVDL